MHLKGQQTLNIDVACAEPDCSPAMGARVVALIAGPLSAEVRSYGVTSLERRQA
jgi:hypothetical protein